MVEAGNRQGGLPFSHSLQHGRESLQMVTRWLAGDVQKFTQQLGADSVRAEVWSDFSKKSFNRK